MEVEYSSEELALEDHTVPSTSTHEFLLETINNLYHHNVITIQKSINDAMQKVIQELEETRKRKTLGSNTEVIRLQKRLSILRDSKDRAITRMQQLREATIRSLEEWEEHNVNFGEEVD